jgi:hypothetical protein
MISSLIGLGIEMEEMNKAGARFLGINQQTSVA